MITAIDHVPPHVPSYHRDFKNATLATTEANLSVETGCQYTFVSRTTTNVIKFEGAVNSSKETTLSEHAIGPTTTLSTANSTVAPSLISQGKSPSAYTTAVSRAQTTTLSGPSVWSQVFDTAVPTLTNLEQNQSVDVDYELIHCAFEGYYTALSSLCSTFSGVYNGMTAQHHSITSPRPILDAPDQTAINSYTEARESRTPALLSLENCTERVNAQATKTRGQGDHPIVATEASSTTAPYQALEESRYGDNGGSVFHPYDTVSRVTRLTSAIPTPQLTICTSGTWNLTSLSDTHTRIEAATNRSKSVTSTPPSAPPILASTGHIATSRCIWVLVCLWAISILHS